MIFLSGARFDAAGNVYCIGLYEVNRLRHIFRRKAACKNDTVRLCGATRDGPIGKSSGTAILACSGSVE